MIDLRQKIASFTVFLNETGVAIAKKAYHHGPDAADYAQDQRRIPHRERLPFRDKPGSNRPPRFRA